MRMWRLNVYKEKAFRLGSILVALVTVLGVILTILLPIQNIPLWMVIPFCLFALLLIPAFAIELRSELPTHVYRREDAEGIRKYLHRWLSNGGRVAIWTRDMSWANDPEMSRLLTGKAQANELIICLPREIARTNELKEAGAEIVAYGTIDAPATSFTITNFERAGSRVAVGRPSGNLHIIQEFSQGEHPAFHMAEDLVRLVRERNNAGI